MLIECSWSQVKKIFNDAQGQCVLTFLEFEQHFTVLLKGLNFNLYVPRLLKSSSEGQDFADNYLPISNNDAEINATAYFAEKRRFPGVEFSENEIQLSEGSYIELYGHTGSGVLHGFNASFNRDDVSVRLVLDWEVIWEFEIEVADRIGVDVGNGNSKSVCDLIVHGNEIQFFPSAPYYFASSLKIEAKATTSKDTDLESILVRLYRGE